MLKIFDYLSCSNNIRMTSEFFNKNKFQNLLLLLKLRSKQHKNKKYQQVFVLLQIEIMNSTKEKRK